MVIEGGFSQEFAVVGTELAPDGDVVVAQLPGLAARQVAIVQTGMCFEIVRRLGDSHAGRGRWDWRRGSGGWGQG